jgi:acetylglutamate kinase
MPAQRPADMPDASPFQRNTAAEKAGVLIEALRYIGKFKGQIVVIKYGGAAMVHEQFKVSFAEDVVLLQSLGMLPVVVHGGGPEVTQAMKAMGQEAQFVEGLRVTNRESLRITEMVLSGSINKDLIAHLNRVGGNGVGVSGKDGRLITARKMESVKGVDLGFVGEIVQIRPELLRLLLQSGYIPVVSPIGMGEDGSTYNINADTAASRIAAALNAHKMLFMTDVDGILEDGKLRSTLTVAEAHALIDRGVISGGMLPKVEALLHCLAHGVKSAHILNGVDPHAIIAELFTDKGIGTVIMG